MPPIFLFFPATGYTRDDHKPIRQMLTDPATLLGLGDGGAHVAMIVDASAPTYMLTHWAATGRAARACRSNMS
jgi:N-acyl-D-aspartate/D-glutamate deacylase